MIIKHMASKQKFLPEKLSKFNSTVHSGLLIANQIKHIVRKVLRAVFALQPQPNGACKITQWYDQATVELHVEFWIPSVMSICIEQFAIQSV